MVGMVRSEKEHGKEHGWQIGQSTLSGSFLRICADDVARSLKDGLQAHSVRAHTGNLSYLHIHIIVDCEGRWLISTPLRPSNLCDILYLLELPGSCFGGSGC
eukprot:1154229-Pelagomonas_calceolata.AAC.1